MAKTTQQSRHKDMALEDIPALSAQCALWVTEGKYQQVLDCVVQYAPEQCPEGMLKALRVALDQLEPVDGSSAVSKQALHQRFAEYFLGYDESSRTSMQSYFDRLEALLLSNPWLVFDELQQIDDSYRFHKSPFKNNKRFASLFVQAQACACVPLMTAMTLKNRIEMAWLTFLSKQNELLLSVSRLDIVDGEELQERLHQLQHDIYSCLSGVFDWHWRDSFQVEVELCSAEIKEPSAVQVTVSGGDRLALALIVHLMCKAKPARVSERFVFREGDAFFSGEQPVISYTVPENETVLNSTNVDETFEKYSLDYQQILEKYFASANKINLLGRKSEHSMGVLQAFVQPMHDVRTASEEALVLTSCGCVPVMFGLEHQGDVDVIQPEFELLQQELAFLEKLGLLVVIGNAVTSKHHYAVALCTDFVEVHAALQKWVRSKDCDISRLAYKVMLHRLPVSVISA